MQCDHKPLTCPEIHSIRHKGCGSPGWLRRCPYVVVPAAVESCGALGALSIRIRTRYSCDCEFHVPCIWCCGCGSGPAQLPPTCIFTLCPPQDSCKPSRQIRSSSGSTTAQSERRRVPWLKALHPRKSMSTLKLLKLSKTFTAAKAPFSLGMWLWAMSLRLCVGGRTTGFRRSTRATTILCTGALGTTISRMMPMTGSTETGGTVVADMTTSSRKTNVRNACFNSN